MATTNNVELIEVREVERQYGFRGTEAIVERDGQRFYIADAYGGELSLKGGAVRWEHGMVVRLLPGDLFATLSREDVSGYSNERPVTISEDAKRLARQSGLI